jgi:hypothetical protein
MLQLIIAQGYEFRMGGIKFLTNPLPLKIWQYHAQTTDTLDLGLVNIDVSARLNMRSHSVLLYTAGVVTQLAALLRIIRALATNPRWVQSRKYGGADTFRCDLT